MPVNAFSDKMEAWGRAEREALEAERALAEVGQAAADPRVADLARQAQALRQRANDLLDEALAHARQGPAAGGSG